MGSLIAEMNFVMDVMKGVDLGGITLWFMFWFVLVVSVSGSIVWFFANRFHA